MDISSKPACYQPPKPLQRIPIFQLFGVCCKSISLISISISPSKGSFKGNHSLATAFGAPTVSSGLSQGAAGASCGHARGWPRGDHETPRDGKGAYIHCVYVSFCIDMLLSMFMSVCLYLCICICICRRFLKSLVKIKTSNLNRMPIDDLRAISELRAFGSSGFAGHLHRELRFGFEVEAFYCCKPLQRV